MHASIFETDCSLHHYNVFKKAVQNQTLNLLSASECTALLSVAMSGALQTKSTQDTVIRLAGLHNVRNSKALNVQHVHIAGTREML